MTVDYSSPDVHGPTGEDRARARSGASWCPTAWRTSASAPAATSAPGAAAPTRTPSSPPRHDVKVQGQPLPAGSYGLHFIPGKEEWTVIFSKNHTSWGSFSYDAKEDALRVKAKPEKSDYHEWLTYEFTDRQPDRARWP